MPTREFSRLTKNVVDLKNEFLRFSQRADGRYTQSELMRCRAFIAFVHAEVEDYLESLALRALKRAESRWNRGNAGGRVIAAVLAYRLNKEVSPPHDPKKTSPQKTLSTLVNLAINNQRSIIQSNNGIRSKNFSELFIPLGIDPDDIEEALIIQLEKFGKSRGGLVHKNAQVSLPQLRDPISDEYQDVKYLLIELQKFDEIAKLL